MSDATDKNLPAVRDMPEISERSMGAIEAASIEAGGLQINTIESAWQFAHFVVQSKMAPSCLDTPAKVLVAIQTGAEVGLSPMASMQAVYVVHGAPAWRTKAAKAIVRKSGLLEPRTDIESGFVHADDCSRKPKECPDGCYGWCTTHRKGMARPHRTEFTIAEARAPGLYPNNSERGQKAAWNAYTGRMLMHRAIGFELDDGFSEVMLGLTIQEAVEDWPQAAFRRQDGGQLPSGAVPAPDPLLAKGDAVVDAEVVGEKAGDKNFPPPEMPPRISNETDAEYTDRLTGADGTDSQPYNHNRNRRCSIGWHGECSDPEGEECECPCHELAGAMGDSHARPVSFDEPLPERVCSLCKIDHPEDEKCPPEPGADDAPVDVDQAELDLG